VTKRLKLEDVRKRRRKRSQFKIRELEEDTGGFVNYKLKYKQ
jgi:hypothetical protein